MSPPNASVFPNAYVFEQSFFIGLSVYFPVLAFIKASKLPIRRRDSNTLWKHYLSRKRSTRSNETFIIMDVDIYATQDRGQATTVLHGALNTGVIRPIAGTLLECGMTFRLLSILETLMP